MNLVTTKDETNEVYHSSDIISASGLKTIYEHKGDINQYLELKKIPYEPNINFIIGNAIHTLCLEGRPEFDKNYLSITEKFDGRTKEGRTTMANYKEMAKKRHLFNYAEHEIIENIYSNFRANKQAVDYCTGTVELSHYSKLNGVDVKVRPDCKNEKKKFISDIKTCASAKDDNIKKDIKWLNYDLQAVFYCDVLGYPPENFRFIFMQKKPPYFIEVVGLSEQSIESGRDKYLACLNQWGVYKNNKKVLPSWNYDEDSKCKRF
jgi:hypothetical protein